MIDRERLTIEVGCEQRLRMTYCRQVNRNEIWVGIPVRVEVN